MSDLIVRHCASWIGDFDAAEHFPIEDAEVGLPLQIQQLQVLPSDQDDYRTGTQSQNYAYTARGIRCRKYRSSPGHAINDAAAGGTQ